LSRREEENLGRIPWSQRKVANMPEWRRLYRSVSDSKKLSRLTSDSPVMLWTWMLPYTDCEGRILADPHYLKGKIVPRFERWTYKTVEENLKILHNVRLIQLYEADGEPIAQFEQPNFEDFQHPRRDKEAKSKFPPPPPRDPGQGPDPLQSKPGKVLPRIEESRVEEERREESVPGQGPELAGQRTDLAAPPSFAVIKKFVVKSWNEFAKSHSLKPIISIAKGSEREKHFKARHEEPAFDWPMIISMAEKSDFCFGNNDRNWKISFDWLIKNPGNYIYILEEKYLDDDQKKREFKLKEGENDPY